MDGKSWIRRLIRAKEVSLNQWQLFPLVRWALLLTASVREKERQDLFHSQWLFLQVVLGGLCWGERVSGATPSCAGSWVHPAGPPCLYAASDPMGKNQWGHGSCLWWTCTSLGLACHNPCHQLLFFCLSFALKYYLSRIFLYICQLSLSLPFLPFSLSLSQLLANCRFSFCRTHR